MSEPLPGVTAVIATVDRPALLVRAVESVLAQTYPGRIDVVVVFDTPEVAPVEVEVPPGRRLRTVVNTRSKGLAGARNTGIGAAETDLVAFCDDDDLWRPTKIERQVALWAAHPEAAVVATGIEIVTEDGTFPREAPATTGFADLIRSRVTELHPSSFLLRRSDLLGPVGLVDEALPSAYGEDYELLLRATRTGPVVAVPEALVRVDWARPSYFAGKWDAMGDGLSYILEQVPEFASDRVGLSRVEGQIAFTHAARGRRREALRWAARAVRHDPRQLRGYGAVAVAAGVVGPDWLLEKVQGRGRGL